MTGWCLLQRRCCGAHQHKALKATDQLLIRTARFLPASSHSLAPTRTSSCEETSTTCRSSFYGGLFHRRSIEVEQELIPQRCSNCGGTGKCTCADCAGRGKLSRAGYNKKNRVDMTRVVGSKWTSMQETMGWRHFRVIQCRKGTSGVAFVQMQASCDPATQLWMNAGNLKDRDLWAAGWLQKSQMEDPQGGLTGGVTCRACSGSGATPCPVCDATGAVLLPPSGLGSPLTAAAGGRNSSPLGSILSGSSIGGGGSPGVISGGGGGAL